MPNNEKILVELSGGVDSCASAIILKDKGLDVRGAMMQLHDTSTFQEDVQNAEEICKRLDLPFDVFDLRKEFRQNVIDYFINSYKNALTPNPCIVCNQTMKFGTMFDLAQKQNCEKLATGHYAQIKYENNTYSLHCAKDKNKDQSYVLHFLNQEQLAKIEFPLGGYTKDEVRQIVKDAGFSFSEKADSQDICFVDDGNYPKFILENSDYKPKPGNVINSQGEIVGTHEGLINYTIGQRKGLGIAFSEPMFITKLNAQENTITLGTKDETFQEEVLIENFNWINPPKEKEFECSAKLRYRQTAKPCKAFIEKDKVCLNYPEKVSAVTPGQFAVLYNGDEVLGGGTIL